ncbi:MAG TPA: aldose 1-epimerase family protein [Clostridiales bacterium]|nr:aldose 1-epimerase family protein [Clostridiales bacterium]
MEVKITNNDLYLTINSYGAEITSLKDIHGREYLWQGDTQYWKGRAPILFPIVGALRNNKAIIDGAEYSMPRHGIARINEFALCSKQTDRAVFKFSANGKTRESFPFDFELEVSYELIQNTLVAGFTVVNKDTRDMPFTIGYHPGFNIPIEADEQLGDYYIKFPQKETCDSPLIDPETSLIDDKNRIKVLENQDYLQLKPELFYNDALILETLKSRSLTVFSIVSGRGIKVDFDGFDYLGLWQPKNAPFLCIEPWTGTATLKSEGDILENKRGMRLLKSGQSQEYIVKITII